MEFRFSGIVREAAADEPVDAEWRPIDLSQDSFEPRGQSTLPLPEPSLLYWWRPNFWRYPANSEYSRPEN